MYFNPNYFDKFKQTGENVEKGEISRENSETGSHTEIGKAKN